MSPENSVSRMTKRSAPSTDQDQGGAGSLRDLGGCLSRQDGGEVGAPASNDAIRARGHLRHGLAVELEAVVVLLERVGLGLADALVLDRDEADGPPCSLGDAGFRDLTELGDDGPLVLLVDLDHALPPQAVGC